MWEKRSSLSIVLFSVIKFMILIVLLIIANVLVPSINNETYSSIIRFLNSLLSLFFILFLIGMINKLFWNFDFPVNMLAPISGGLLGVFIVQLVSKIIEFTQTFVYFDVLRQILAYPISTIVFFATIIIGYLIIISEAAKEERYFGEEKPAREENKKRKLKEKMKPSKSENSWDRVGDEFRRLFFNIGKALNKPFDGKTKKKKSKNKKS
jgi:hypothetical protein